MRLQDISPEVRRLFLREFTKELIKTQSQFQPTIEEDVLKKKAKEIYERRQKEKEEHLQEQKERKVKWQEFKESLISQNSLPKAQPKIPKPTSQFIRPQQPIQTKNQFQQIPKQPRKLPQPSWKKFLHIGKNKSKQITPSNVKPKIHQLKPQTQTKKPKVNLGKLNPLISDPTVTVIVCNSPESHLEVKRGNAMIKSSIILNQQEIEHIIQTFSRASKIPVTSGSFRAVVENLIISAIIYEDNLTQRFTISKILPRL